MPAAAPAWYTRPTFRRAALALLIVIALAEGYVAVAVRRNDLITHRDMGTAFLEGEPYKYAQEIYPLPRVMLNVLLAVGPVYPTRLVCYLLALAALVGCYAMWRRMADVSGEAPQGIDAAAGLGAALLTLPFLLRDLDDCGLQTFLLFFLTAAGFALQRGGGCRAGFWLATAAIYKATPLLFLPFLLWKRQWKPALATAVFALLWCIAPAAFLGVEKTLECHGRWLGRALKLGTARQAYPSQLDLEEPKVYNLSLQAAVARYLETYPPGHPLYLDHPAFLQPGDLPAETAYGVVRGVGLLLALLLAWRFRRRWRRTAAGQDLAAEWAAVCLLCAILSPVCWKQHLVLILPAAYLSLRGVLSQTRLRKWRLAALLGVASVFLLSRHFVVGGAWADVLLSYKVDTYAILVLLLLVLTLPKGVADAGGGATRDEYRVLAFRMPRKHRARPRTAPTANLEFQASDL